jgi:hypothetical protein
VKLLLLGVKLLGVKLLGVKLLGVKLLGVKLLGVKRLGVPWGEVPREPYSSSASRGSLLPARVRLELVFTASRPSNTVNCSAVNGSRVKPSRGRSLGEDSARSAHEAL